MLSTSSTLIEAARSASATPYVRVRLSDRDIGVPRLRFSRWYEGAEDDGPSAAAVPTDGSLLRAWIDPDTSVIAVQRVTTPSATSDYSGWTSLTTAEASAGLGLHAAGTRALLAYYDGSAVLVRESTDSGATFGSATTVATTADVTAVGCAIREDGAALAVWARGGVVYTSSRPAAGSWGSPAAWSHSLDAVNAIAVSDLEDWAILVSGEDGDGAPGCWSTRFGSGVGGPPGHWSALAPVLVASPGLDVSYLATGVCQAGAPRALLVETYAGTGAFDRAMIATGLAGGAFGDGEWQDPTPFAHASPWGVAAAARGTHAYLASSSGVWHAEVGGTPVDVTPSVVAAHYEADTRSERLRLTLDASLLATPPEVGPEIGTEVEFSPGYLTDAGYEFAAGRFLWVTVVERRRGEVHLTAEGALGRLARWRAPRQTAWAAGDATIASIARSIVRAAGVRAVTGSASLSATTLTPGFTVRAGESALAALTRLLERVPDQVFGRGLDLRLVERDPDEAATYAYGTADPAHAVHALDFRDAEGAPGWARVLGAGAVGEAVGTSEGGVAVVADATITTADLATARAGAALRRAVLAEERGTLEAAPHPGHEPGDVIAVTDATLGLDAEAFRITSVELDYRQQPRAKYVMRLGLGNV